MVPAAGDLPAHATKPKGIAASVMYYNLNQLEKLYHEWNERMPGVVPHYAVKCNPDPRIVETLSRLGCHFDCASPAEVDLVLGTGAAPERILYANPCKHPRDLQHAYVKGIRATTADTVAELKKIAKHAPGMEVILRIYACDPTARCVLSNRFGAHPHDWEALMDTAARLEVPVTGVSFHVGSGACKAEAFQEGIQQAVALTVRMEERGLLPPGGAPWIIDIGGGFSGGTLPTLAEPVLRALYEHAPRPGFHWIAEPGRYFAETIGTIETPIIGIREHPDGRRDLTVYDSIYGSFNCIMYDHAAPVPEAPSFPETETVMACGHVYGATCDGLDQLATDVQLPKGLRIGDALVWRNMGSYTMAAATHFNGLPFPEAKRVYFHEAHA